MEQKHVLVVGGGASGMAAAVSAASSGASVTLLERFQKLGRKLLATGNGRCNLANIGQSAYFGDPVFADAVLSAMPPAAILDTFSRWGLATVVEGEGRVYPAAGQASAVQEVLLARLKQYGVQVVLNAQVRDLTLDNGRYLARTEDLLEYTGDACILATGGMAGGNLGCDMGAYALALGLGHTLAPLAPALAPLIAERGTVRRLAGLRVPAIVTLMNGTSPLAAAQGEVLFADYGVSGICIMQLAREAYTVLAKGGKPWLSMDFSPLIGLCPRIFGRLSVLDRVDYTAAVRALLEKRANELPQEELLLGLLPGALAKCLMGAPLDALPDLLTKYPVIIQGVRSFENAQVTGGGVDTSEVNPYTLASLRADGLYLTGEMLNVDGDCGGYNLMFAFACGLLAGKSAAQCAED